jgi:hypothetical protein
MATPGTPVVEDGAAPYRLSIALGAVSLAACALSFAVASLLRGAAVEDGSLRGTALVLICVALPLLGVCMFLTARGSPQALVAWLGTLLYIAYQAGLFLFATPFNRLFLLYAAMLGLSAWSIGTLLARIDIGAVQSRLSGGLPVRALSLYVWLIVTLNAIAWLGRVLPGVLTDKPPVMLTGTGLVTNPIIVQDLALWLPLFAVVALWLWRRRPWGAVLVGGILVYWVVESVGIASDQWFGHRADPPSQVASAGAVPAFAVLAIVGLIPLYFLMRSFDVDPGQVGSEAVGRGRT